MRASILKWLAVGLLAALAVYLVVRGYESWRGAVFAEGDRAGAARVQEQWSREQIERGGQILAEVAAARADEQRIAADAAKGERNALKKAEQRAAADRDAAGRSAAAADGLSRNIAALDAAAGAVDLTDIAACPGEFVRQRDAAVRARRLFGSCVAAYRDLGEGVDDAWRAVNLKLDTALSYINAVAPP